MAKINLRQLIHDIKEAYVSASGDTEAVTYGNIADKIANIRSGGGVIGGHTVTFKSDGNDYAIVSVTDGQSVSAPSPNPTSESGTFNKWLNGENAVDFPFTPTNDTEINAEFVNLRTDMEWHGNGLWFKNDYRTYNKVNAERTIQGYSWVSTDSKGTEYYIFCRIGETENSVLDTNTSWPAIRTYDYDGKTYYCCLPPQENSKGLVINEESKTYYINPDHTFTLPNWEAVAKAVLDRYFCKD